MPRILNITNKVIFRELTCYNKLLFSMVWQNFKRHFKNWDVYIIKHHWGEQLQQDQKVLENLIGGETIFAWRESVNLCEINGTVVTIKKCVWKRGKPKFRRCFYRYVKTWIQFTLNHKLTNLSRFALLLAWERIGHCLHKTLFSCNSLETFSHVLLQAIEIWHKNS